MNCEEDIYNNFNAMLVVYTQYVDFLWLECVFLNTQDTANVSIPERV
ncbi:hypothetical protein GCM10011607_17230 [Shewanella inventionis]|uniref:Uncharacterized protein n=1 Tax=Shewanella inventionis TaxID=1738770 RepID=A0ABQ1J2G3_9GAMM|nr:hypothetical protein GCM10011607_17230 [Shewanella inventionis]